MVLNIRLFFLLVFNTRLFKRRFYLNELPIQEAQNSNEMLASIFIFSGIGERESEILNRKHALSLLILSAFCYQPIFEQLSIINGCQEYTLNYSSLHIQRTVYECAAISSDKCKQID